MPSTFSPNLRLELPTNGEQAGTWGSTTNRNLGTLVESAITGHSTVVVTSANQALTALAGVDDQARKAIITLTTTTTAGFAVYVPPTSKLYVVRNNTAYTATVYASTVIGNTTAAGAGVAIPAGRTMSIWTDGVAVGVQSDLHLGNVVGDVFGNATSATNAATATTAANAAAVTNGVYTVGAQTIEGIKTFSSPIVGDITGNAATATTADTADTATSVARTISAAGLATGGGILTADRTITVPKATQSQAEAGVDDATAMTPLTTRQAVDIRIAAKFAAAQTIDPAGVASVIFSGLTQPFYTVLLDGVQPASGSNLRIVLDVSSNGGTAWTTVYVSDAVNWTANGGLSGLFQFFTAPCVGYAATGYRNVVSSTKNGKNTIVPTGTGPTINAARIRWESGNFGAAAAQKIQLFER